MTTVNAAIPLSANTQKPIDILGIKQEQAGLVESQQKIKSNELTLQAQQQQMNAVQSDAMDSAKMRTAISSINPNDPDFDTKAVDSMWKAGVSPEKIAAFKTSSLAGQLQVATLDEKKAQAAKVKEDTIGKFDENQVKAGQRANDAISPALKDTIDTYDSLLSKAGPNPSQGALQTAKTAAATMFKAHGQAILDSMDPKDPMYKPLQAELAKPFDINSVRAHYDQSTQAQALFANRQQQLTEQKTQAEIKHVNAETASSYASAQASRASAAAAGKQVIQTTDENGKAVFGVIDKGTGKVVITPDQVAPKGTAASGGGREATMLGRQMNALAEGTKALENLSESSTTSSKGFFNDYDPGTGFIGVVKKGLGDTITSDQAKSYQVMTAGLSRAAATMETSGLAPSGTLSSQLHDAIEIKPTDSTFVAMRKMAEARQILEEPIKNLKANPNLTADQKTEIGKFEKRLQDAVPYTQHDLTNFEQKGTKNQSFGDYAKVNGLGAKTSGTKTAADDTTEDFSQYARK